MYDFISLNLVEQSKLIKKFVLVTFSIIIVFIALLFLPWQQTVQGIAKLTALNPSQRDYTVAATIDGFIENFYVKENQFIHKGDRLFTMIDLDTHYQNRLENTKQQTESQYENEEIKLKYLEENIFSLNSILKNELQIYKKTKQQLSNEISVLQEQLKVADNTRKIEKRNYERSVSLFKDGIASERDLELKKNSYLQSKAEYKKLTIALKNTKHTLGITNNKEVRFKKEMGLKINIAKNTLLSTHNSLNRLKQKLNNNETLISRYSSRDIVAKSDGYVLRIYQNDTNKIIKRGEKILYFSPLVTKRALRLKVSDFHMPLMKKDLKARIIFYGWPAMQISGWPKISHGTYGGIIESIERSSYEQGVYYVLITEDIDDTPWPSSDNLKIGTQATVWVRLDIVSIWYEIWRLMISQPPKMITPGQQEEVQRW